MGRPGNDDKGTMSRWAICNMMGLYHDCPGVTEYTLTTHTCDKVTSKLDEKWNKQSGMVIETDRTSPDQIYIDETFIGDKKKKGFRITHDELINAGSMKFKVKK